MIENVKEIDFLRSLDENEKKSKIEKNVSMLK